MEIITEHRLKLKQQARAQFEASIQLKQKILHDEYLNKIVLMAETIFRSLEKGGKLMLCGNGGSAADAQHLAAEFLVRLRSHVDREALPAIALAMDTSTLTACANDYSFECLYERMVQGLGRPGDILLGITTSGRSKNVIRALQAARIKNIITLGFLGGDGGEALQECDISFVVPSKETGRIQEVHITLGHILIEMIEDLWIG